jgi:hypothetical protein
MTSRFPYEKSEWHSAESERWLEALERYGTENVRSVLTGAYGGVGSRAAISIGTVMDIPKGFAQEWLAWHDHQKAEREAAFRIAQVFWTRWAALAASLAALAAAIGWFLTAWRKW